MKLRIILRAHGFIDTYIEKNRKEGRTEWSLQLLLRISSLKIPTYVLKSFNLYRFQLVIVLKNHSQRPSGKRSQADHDEDWTASSRAGEISSDSAGGPLLSELRGIFTLKEGKRTALKPFLSRKDVLSGFGKSLI